MKTLQQIFPPIKDADGKSVKCSCPGCRRVARHVHHNIPRCQGGTDDPQNLVYLCQRCHVAHHSAKGDFARWGKFGGKITASTKAGFRNLVQFRGEAGAKRYAAWLEKHADMQMGVQ